MIYIQRQPQIGERMSGKRFVWDEAVDVSGTITRVERQGRSATVYVRTDAGYIDHLDVSIDAPATAAPAKPPTDDDDDDFVCHYCGMPAVSLNFFDVPVCRECGG